MIHKNWIACTPMAFRGDEQTFFNRDSGLCCRALQTLGVNAKVVMPEPAWDDEPDVLRVPYSRLSEPEFWREQGVDAVILYSWADPRYTKIAAAIHEGGSKLFLNMDTGGLMSPFVEPGRYIRSIWLANRHKRGLFLGLLFTLCSFGWQSVGLHRHFSRLRQMSCADAIGVVSPIGAERVRKYARFFRRLDITKKIHFVSHPINQVMHYTGCLKKEVVIAVGRWSDSVKRPDILIDVAIEVLSRSSTVSFIVVGEGATRCTTKITTRFPDTQNRVIGYERLEHDVLCEHLNLSQISLCTSRSEGFHTVSGEALLSGCSIVAPLSPRLPSLPYFVDGGFSGRLAEKNTVDSLAVAILEELAAWRDGQRDPTIIAQTWRKRIAAGIVVKKIDKLLSQVGSNRII